MLIGQDNIEHRNAAAAAAAAEDGDIADGIGSGYVARNGSRYYYWDCSDNIHLLLIRRRRWNEHR